MILNIIQNLPLHKKSKEILTVIVRTILETEVPSIREMARKAISKMFVNPLDYSSSQSLVNRIRRFFNSHKWDYIKAQQGTVFTFDREFTYPKLMEFLRDNGMYFVIRLKKTVYVDNKPISKLSPGIYEDVMVHKIRANVYLKGYLNINGKIDFYAYVSNLPKEKLTWELYKERMKIEEMFRDEKTLVKTEDHRVELLNIYSMILKVSKTGRLVLMLEGR